MSREINNTPAEAIVPEQLYECVGIEVFVTQGLARRVAEKKRAHVNAILSEQIVQEQQGVSDLKKLSGVSEKSSRWTKERAQKLAVGYSAILDL